MKYRIITDGRNYKVQYSQWRNPFWKTVQRPEDFRNKESGGDKVFENKEDAQSYINIKKIKTWDVVK